MKLLLLSNSTIKGEAYLGWPKQYLDEFTADVSKIAFIPYAGVTVSFDDYTNSVQKAMGLRVEVVGIHSVDDKIELLNSADCIAIGGGNTFQLLKLLQENNLMQTIKKKVALGVPYIGWSAGSNVACPTIMTTNDMPIVQPDSFEALGLVDFQINAHYTDKVINGHGGESRKQRLDEFLEVNQQVSIIGLPEGKLLHLDGNKWHLKGIESEPTYMFKYMAAPVKIDPGQVHI